MILYRQSQPSHATFSGELDSLFAGQSQARQYETAGIPGDRRRSILRLPMFVACEADGDISYLPQYIGEDHLITGSDYGHNDRAEQAQLIAAMEVRGEIAAALKDKSLRKNTRKFYGI
jgi:hypothetical protein